MAYRFLIMIGVDDASASCMMLISEMNNMTRRVESPSRAGRASGVENGRAAALPLRKERYGPEIGFDTAL